jgi:hypothetical protein
MQSVRTLYVTYKFPINNHIIFCSSFTTAYVEGVQRWASLSWSLQPAGMLLGGNETSTLSVLRILRTGCCYSDDQETPFNGTRKFTTVFQKVRHWTLSRASSLQSTHSPVRLIIVSTPSSPTWSLPLNRFPAKGLLVCVSMCAANIPFTSLLI